MSEAGGDPAMKGPWGQFVGEQTAEGCLPWRRKGLESGHLFLMICRLAKWKVIRCVLVVSKGKLTAVGGAFSFYLKYKT